MPYIQIHGANCINYSGGVLNDECTTTAADRDAVAGIVRATGQVFQLEVNTMQTVTASNTIGFSLVYHQIPCGSGQISSKSSG